MLRSPLIDEMVAWERDRDIIKVLVARFGDPANDILPLLTPVVEDEASLDRLMDLSLTCPDLVAFHSGLNDVVANLPPSYDEFEDLIESDPNLSTNPGPERQDEER